MKFRARNLKKYVEELTALSNRFNVEVCCENAVTKGAEIVYKETLEALKQLPVDNRRRVDGEKRTSINSLQKAALISVFGVTPIQYKNGAYDNKTGVDVGYNKIGQPHVVIARSLEKGTSFMNKNPVFSRASRKARKGCIEAMQESLTTDIEKCRKSKLRREKGAIYG